jgi:hypothetical protein
MHPKVHQSSAGTPMLAETKRSPAVVGYPDFAPRSSGLSPMQVATIWLSSTTSTRWPIMGSSHAWAASSLGDRRAPRTQAVTCSLLASETHGVASNGGEPLWNPLPAVPQMRFLAKRHVPADGCIASSASGPAATVRGPAHTLATRRVFQVDQPPQRIIGRRNSCRNASASFSL